MRENGVYKITQTLSDNLGKHHFHNLSATINWYNVNAERIVRAENTWGFHLSASCYIILQPRLAYDTREGFHYQYSCEHNSYGDWRGIQESTLKVELLKDEGDVEGVNP